MSKRTDIHRPGAIIPAHYTSVLAYSLATSEAGCPIPAIGVDCATPRTQYDAVTGRAVGTVTPQCPDTGWCCVRSAERHARILRHEVFDAPGRCGVCGAHFIYGTAFRHDDGDLVHMGHDCADKYEVMQDLSAWEIENGRTRAALATAIARARNIEAREAFLAAHPGLSDAFALGSTAEGATQGAQIIADIESRFVRWLSISDKQIKLVNKLADEIRNPKAVIEERHCAAPVGAGRVTFSGEVVSCKMTDGYQGAIAFKMTVKVTVEDGATWLAYGTCPASLADAYGNHPISDMRGRMVEVTAKLELPRDRRDGQDHFAFMVRPAACFVDVFDHPRYQRPKCVIGEPCRVICRKFNGLSGEWTENICDGACGNAPKTRKPRAGKPRAADTATDGGCA